MDGIEKYICANQNKEYIDWHKSYKCIKKEVLLKIVR